MTAALIAMISTLFANFRFSLRIKTTAGAPASSKTNELTFNTADWTLYIGTGNDGQGNATGHKAIGGDAKADKAHGHAVTDVTGLQAALDERVSISTFVQTVNSKADLALTEAALGSLGQSVAGNRTAAEQANALRIAEINALRTTAEAKQAPATTLAGYGITDAASKADLALVAGIDATQAAALLALSTAANADEANILTLTVGLAAEKAARQLAETALNGTLTQVAGAAQTAQQVQDAIRAAFAAITVVSGGSAA